MKLSGRKYRKDNNGVWYDIKMRDEFLKNEKIRMDRYYIFTGGSILIAILHLYLMLSYTIFID